MPWQSDPARLELVVLGADGAYERAVRIPGEWVDTTGTSDVIARVPLLLGLRNVGGEAVRPERIQVSVPLQFRLAAGASGASGLTVGRVSPAGPLVQYDLRADLPVIEPDGEPVALPVTDRLWLQVVSPRVYCVATSDSVPTFVPAPPVSEDALRRAQLFYSIRGPDTDERSTGLLAIQLDPGTFRSPESDSTARFLATAAASEGELPSLAALGYVGHRRSICGEPARPLELFTTLWETPNGGRFFVLDYGGAPRKYLFDLDRDSVIELEMWDATGDGEFDTRQALNMPIPPFLLPRTPEPGGYELALDTVSEETLARLRVFSRALAGPYEPVTQPPDSADAADGRRVAILQPRTILRSGDRDEHEVIRDRSTPDLRLLGERTRTAAGTPRPGIAPGDRSGGAPAAANPAGAAAAPGTAGRDAAAGEAGGGAAEDGTAAEDGEEEDDGDGIRLLGVPVDSVRADSAAADTTGG